MRADLDAGYSRDFDQGEGFTYGLPKVDPAAMGDQRAGDVHVLGVKATAFAVASTDIGYRCAGVHAERAGFTTLTAVTGLD